MIIQARDALSNLVSGDIRTIILQEIKGAEALHGKGGFVLLVPSWLFNTLDALQVQMSRDNHTEGPYEGPKLYGNPIETSTNPEISYRAKED